MISRSQLANEIIKLEKEIELSNSLNQLKTNKQYNSLITEEYLKEYPLRLVRRLGTLVKDSPEYLEVVAELDAISRLNNYLNNINNQGQLAASNILEAKSIPESELYDE